VIEVETDAAEDWGGGTDWAALAGEAVRAAVGASAHAALLDSGITIEVSVKLGGDEEVRALNAAYRGRDKATNVLSFPMLDAGLIATVGKADGGEVLLGDVVLAHGVCLAEARDKGLKVSAHAAHLIVHGTLHLLGYDHETSEPDAAAMEEVERRALATIGVADPYLTEVQS